MISSARRRLVSRKVATPGGTDSAIERMRRSGIGPGPLGIADTSPTALAPWAIASRASSTLCMQQTLNLTEDTSLLELPFPRASIIGSPAALDQSKKAPVSSTGTELSIRPLQSIRT